MFLPSFTTTYSSNVNLMVVLCVGTFVVPGSGSILTIMGGMVSFMPPEGACVVLAQEGEKNMDPNTSATGMAGIHSPVDNLFFLIAFQFFVHSGYP